MVHARLCVRRVVVINERLKKKKKSKECRQHTHTYIIRWMFTCVCVRVDRRRHDRVSVVVQWLSSEFECEKGKRKNTPRTSACPAARWHITAAELMGFFIFDWNVFQWNRYTRTCTTTKRKPTKETTRLNDRISSRFERIPTRMKIIRRETRIFVSYYRRAINNEIKCYRNEYFRQIIT